MVTNPVLPYSTYLGGSSDDVANAVTTDSAGNVYVAGYTASTNFPTTTGAYKTANQGGVYDAFVSKFSPAGTLVYSTYLGGSGNDIAYGIAVDSAGNAYVTGSTSSADFPTTTGAYRTAYNGGTTDAFVVKLNPTGTALVYSTYVGGIGDDIAYGIALDSTNQTTITGSTTSLNFPTSSGAFQTAYGGGLTNAFVARLNPAGTALTYSTYLGGTGQDAGYGIAVDSQGLAYVTGYTQSTNFPTTTGAVQTSYAGSSDAFVTALNTTGTAQVYSTYLGGSSDDYGFGIAVDAASNAYVTGYTSSPNFPTTTGALQTSIKGGYDAFVSKISPAGNTLGYSTYLGGSGDDFGLAIAVDSAGNVYLTGETASTDFPATANASQSVLPGTYSALVVKLNSAGNSLTYGSYLGGSGFDTGYGIAVNAARSAYVTGYTVSSDFPTTSGAVSQTLAGGSDAFLSQISPPVGTVTSASETVVPGTVANIPVTLTLESGVTLSGLSFALSVSPSASAPALTGTLAFVKDAAMPNPTSVDTSAGPNAITVTWSNLSPPLGSTSSATTISLGQVAVSIPASMSGAETYTATITTIAGSSGGTAYALGTGPNATLSLPLSYLVGDAFPYTGDNAAQFGDGLLNTLDLITALRAVTKLPGFLPATCSDRFDAMDAFPLDGSGDPTILTGRPGGDGLLNTLDLIATLRRVTNIDTSRPTRVSRGRSCPLAAPQARTSETPGGVLELVSDGRRAAIYLLANLDLSLSGLAFSLASDDPQLQFVPAGGQSPTLIDNALPGALALAWLDGWQAKAGDRVLLGYVETSALLRFTGASANATGTGGAVVLGMAPIKRR